MGIGGMACGHQNQSARAHRQARTALAAVVSRAVRPGPEQPGWPINPLYLNQRTVLFDAHAMLHCTAEPPAPPPLPRPLRKRSTHKEDVMISHALLFALLSVLSSFLAD